MNKFQKLKNYMSYINLREKKTFFWFITFQFLAGIFEIIAISIAGLAVTLVTLKVTGQKIPTYLKNVFQFFSISDIYAHRVLFFLVFFSASFLILKTLISTYLNLKLNLFLGRITSRISTEKISLLSRIDYNWLKGHDNAAVSYYLGAGITNDLKSILLGISTLISEGIFLLTLLLYLIVVDYKIAITLFILIGFTSYFMIYVSHKKLRRLGSSEIEVITQNNSMMLAYLRGYKELRISRAINRFENKLNVGKSYESDLRARIQWLEQIPKFFLEVVVILIGLLLFIFSALSSNAQWGTSTLLTFSLVIVRATPSLLRFQTGASLIRFNVTRFDSTESFLIQLIPRSNQSLHSPPESFPIKGSVLFESVSFSYSGETPLLKDISFQAIGPGVTCISGKSGVGKSTILELLVGLVDPDEGTITIDGKPPAVWNSMDATSMYYLPQEVFILEASLRNNLCLGLSHAVASDEVLLKILADVGLQSIISRGSVSLDVILIRELSLSGGERQRLGFARALLARPNLLILDEPTAALDQFSEKQIFHLIQEIAATCNIILVSHSESLGQFFDHPLTLENYRISD
jgi:ATP-binding cassette subfamily C protein